MTFNVRYLLSLDRDRLKTFQIKCWSSGEVECSDSELGQGECWVDMDPSRILGTDSECKAAFFATVGTPLHRPCSCKGQHGEHLLKCSKIQSVFHNRSHFGEYGFDLQAVQRVQRNDFIFPLFPPAPIFQWNPGKVLPNCLRLMTRRQITHGPMENMQAGGKSGHAGR